jgi:hypothetical protein
MEQPGSVTLVFYRLLDKWWQEPYINVMAAAAQFSTITHTEIAIGSNSGDNGMMTNVCRIFNDNTGCELVQRAGKNPQFIYLQLGCTKAQEVAMLNYAKRQVGKPFSRIGMLRSLVCPRASDESSWCVLPCSPGFEPTPNLPASSMTTTAAGFARSWLQQY